MESEGLLPVPVFINGVEAHTVVRDLLTSDAEAAGIARGELSRGTPSRDAVRVDALVNTIGFPLVRRGRDCILGKRGRGLAVG